MDDTISTDRRSVLKRIGAGVATGVAFAGSAGAQPPGQLASELAAVRSATAAYNDTDHAADAGYVAEDAPPVCGMGHHWPNPGLLDFELEKEHPEILVYGERNGNLVLGAVEYAIPKVDDQQPDLFEHADPEWHVLQLPPDAPIPFEALWTLHVWVHNHNPEGVFHPTNPRTLFSPPGCVDHGGGDH